MKIDDFSTTRTTFSKIDWQNIIHVSTLSRIHQPLKSVLFSVVGKRDEDLRQQFGIDNYYD